jgi:hypothetical protein
MSSYKISLPILDGQVGNPTSGCRLYFRRFESRYYARFQGEMSTQYILPIHMIPDGENKSVKMETVRSAATSAIKPSSSILSRYSEAGSII